MGVLTTIGIIALVAGTAATAKGQIQAGRAAKRQGEYNAGVAEGQADDALRRGEEDVSAFRRQVRGLIGQERAGYAGQNIDVSVGTAAAIQEDTFQLGGMDLERIRRNAQREAMGYKVEAENYRRGAAYASSAARWGAASTILGGSSTLLLQRYGWQERQPRTPSPRGG